MVLCNCSEGAGLGTRVLQDLNRVPLCEAKADEGKAGGAARRLDGTGFGVREHANLAVLSYLMNLRPTTYLRRSWLS